MTTWIIVGIVITLVIVAVLIRAAAWSMSEHKQLERELRDSPRTTAARLEAGATGRLAGVVTSDATLRAPLTGRACVAYVARVEERMPRGQGARWVERIHEIRGVPFTLDDGTGRALIDPGQSTLLLQMDATTRSGILDSATPVEASFLERHGVASTGVWLNKTLRYTEGVIEPGERVAIVGRGVREPDPDAGPDALATRIRLGGSEDQPILITNRADLIGP